MSFAIDEPAFNRSSSQLLAPNYQAIGYDESAAYFRKIL